MNGHGFRKNKTPTLLLQTEQTNQEASAALILIICVHVEHFSGAAPGVMVEQ